MGQDPCTTGVLTHVLRYPAETHVLHGFYPCSTWVAEFLMAANHEEAMVGPQTSSVTVRPRNPEGGTSEAVVLTVESIRPLFQYQQVEAARVLCADSREARAVDGGLAGREKKVDCT